MLAHGHVLVAIGEERLPSFRDAYLDRIGMQRNVAMTVPGFAMMLRLLQETDWLTLMRGRLAALMERNFAIASAPPPVAIPKIVAVAQYHITRTNDPGLRWLIHAIRDHGVSGPTTAGPRP